MSSCRSRLTSDWIYRSDSGGKPEIYHASEQQRRDSLYRPKEDTDEQEEAVGETEEADNAEHIVTNQTDSLDSTTLEIQSSPGGKADSLLAKDDTFPELRWVHYYNEGGH